MRGSVLLQVTKTFDFKNVACLILGGLILVLLSPLILAYMVFVAIGFGRKGFA